MTATKPPSRLALLVSVAIVLGCYVWAWWRLLHVDATPGPLPFLVGAAALPLMIVGRAAATVGRALVVMALLVGFSLIAPEPIVDSFDAGVAAFIVCAGTILTVWLIVRAIRRGRDNDDDDDGPAGGAGGTGDRLVGLWGYTRSGKDTAAAGLIEDGWTRVGMGDLIERICHGVDPLVPAVGDPDSVGHDEAPIMRVERLARQAHRRGWRSAKDNPELLEFSQRVGITLRDVLGSDVLLDALMANLPAGDKVFTSVRYPNEAQAIKDAGGIVLRVDRPGVGPANDAATERAMEDWPFDAVLVNDGTPDQLADALRKAVTHTA